MIIHMLSWVLRCSTQFRFSLLRMVNGYLQKRTDELNALCFYVFDKPPVKEQGLHLPKL